MLREAIDFLKLKPGMVVVDGTVGCGGHAKAMLKEIGKTGVLIGMDWDEQALGIAKKNLCGKDYDVRLHRRNFKDLRDVLAEEGIDKVDALFFDLGLSSVQLETPDRGFSFSRPAPLDMRMDRRRRRTAADILRESDSAALADIFRRYGEEKLAGPIARKIAEGKPPATTVELAEIAEAAYRGKGGKKRISPATRIFQALRISVNDELENLKELLPDCVEVAKKGVRIVIISFHSLEDRIVKEEFSKFAAGCICPPQFPECRCGHEAQLKIITKKPVVPQPYEVKLNPRARSAKLRAAEKI
jgi:16S rRNA (cytosine1402-N4)-methyltransferase